MRLLVETYEEADDSLQSELYADLKSKKGQSFLINHLHWAAHSDRYVVLSKLTVADEKRLKQVVDSRKKARQNQTV